MAQAQESTLAMRPAQHRALRQITERLARLIAAGVSECHGAEVPVFFAYQDPQGSKKVSPHLTLLHYWVERVGDRMPDRELIRTPDGDEFFRNPPLLMVARYMLTAWAPPPQDQEILAAALRVLHDAGGLDPDGAGEEDAVHWEDRPAYELSKRFSLDEARLVAESHGMPLRASARLDIPFRLDSDLKTTIKRVKERIVDYKKLDG